MTFSHAPSRWELPRLLDYTKEGEASCVTIAGITIYCPARPEGFFSIISRIRLAWDVFKGEADALYWPLDR